MKKLLLLLFITSYSCYVSAQNNESIYKAQWHEIDSIIVEKDLPKTALEKVDAIYKDAKKKNLSDEIIKALLYKLSLEDKTQEDDVNRDYRLFADELANTSNAAVKSILQVLLASNLNDYYNQNSWKNSQRKETITYKEADITTWSNQQLLSTIDSLFEQSLIPATQLKQTNIESYAAIIIKGNAPGTRPTLYDLIAHEALDYYKTGMRYITETVYTFKVKEESCLSSTEVFMNYSFDSKDTLSDFLKALQLFQQLMQFHKNDTEPTAFIDVNLERINWVNNRVYFENKDALYKKALLDITDHYTNTKPAAEAWYLLAKIETAKAATYKPFEDTTQRYANVTAKKLIKERLRAMPDSCYGNDQMKGLLQQITKPELSTQVEGINVADQPFRMLVNYKNVDTLYARVILQKDITKAAKKKNYNEWRDISKLPFTKSFIQFLPKTNDYQKHSVEIKIDALPVGDYTILFSNSNSFTDSTDKLVTQELSVSNLAYMRNEYDYFVVDRESGQPIKDVKAKGTIEIKKGNDWKTKKLKAVYTDEHGHFSIPIDPKQKENYGDVDITLSKDKDILDASASIEYYSYSNDDDDDEDDDGSTYENDNSHVYFFTDRSIYRPGQTVFFKGIFLTKDRKTKKYKLYHYTDSAEIDLNDANGKMIDSMFVKLNEYGSFSGKFKLPTNALTGEFSIDTYDFEDGEANFNVEEYKRPTFYVEFDTLKNSYRLGDTIKLTGYAKAYAGNAVDNAKVNYTIQRSASFPYPYLFWKISRPYSRTKEIADSTIAVDENGKFEISFVAEPDSSVAKSTEPLFDFQIETSVTDANGETREEKTNVKISYKSLVLQVSVPGIADVNNFKNIFITTKNNADENVPAVVKIKVSPLQTPIKAYRKRQWSKPDQFVMDKASFESYFPYDEYAGETDYHEWKQLPAVVEDTFNTTKTSNYKLKTINLKQGWYCIEATTKDKDGSEIKDVRYIQLYDMNVAGLPSPQLNFSQMLSNSGQPGDKAQLLIGTSEPNVFAVQKISGKDNDTANTFSYLSLSNNKQKLEYTIQSNDYNNIGLYYAFIKHNSFYTGGIQVYTNNDKRSLQINYATYRNKTEPGSKETWSVQVSNADNSKADAELLTSMYDASLDQFKKQEWEIPQLNSYSSLHNKWDGEEIFSKQGSNTNSTAFLFHGFKIYSKLLHSYFDLPGYYANPKHMKIPLQQELQGRLAGLDISQEGDLNDVVVTGYGVAKKNMTTASLTVLKSQNISDTSFFKTKIRGIASVSDVNTLLIIVDGIPTEKKIDEIDANEIDHVEILKGSEATALYGSKASNGAIIVTTKGFALRNANKKKEEPPIQIRTNFNETAFFFPQLHEDSSGKYTFSFTMPDALTQWKWMSFAHTKDIAFGLRNQTVVTQKTLMVQPNLPRFLREGDKLEITAKISNLADSAVTGISSVEFFDAFTNQPIDGLFQSVFPEQYFTAEANRSTIVKFPVSMPFNFNKPVTIKIIAKGNDHSDGEENTIPVLSNRMLITETLPLYMPGEGSKEFKFEKLLNNKSETLTNESLTVEYTPNPVWYAIQSLPYLAEFPYECAEQTFNRFYANALAAYIVAKHPAIKEVFEKWKSDTTALQSNLLKNAELKQILLNETPWVLDAENEEQQRKNIALLFDVVNMTNKTQSALNKLKQMQLSNGAFPWFSSGYADRYITQYILTGIAKLDKLNAIPENAKGIIDDIENKAIIYLDKAIADDYNELVKNKTDLTKELLTPTQIQYWYMRSLFGGTYEKSFPADAFKFALQQTEKYWTKQNPYMQGMLALALNNLLPAMKPAIKFKNPQLDIIKSLKENAVVDSAKGTFWKNSKGYYWYQSPIETQSLLIEAFKEITPDDPIINDMQHWLLLNKQTNNWGTTKATADACYALLSAANLNQTLYASIQLGDSSINTVDEIKQSGTDYIKHRIEGKDVQPQMGNISVGVSNPLAKSNSYPPSYGAVYWQYFEDIDKITTAASPLSVTKKIFIEKNSDKGKILQPITDTSQLRVGDKVVVRLVIKCDRNMEYIHLKDMRASCMEPDNVLSEYKYQDGLSYYASTRDAATNFFISNISKGTYVLEYPVHLTHIGDFSAGIATIQCMYAPEFSANSDGIRINVEEQ